MRTFNASAGTSSPLRGAGRLLVVAYAILSLAALGRSAFQIFTKFDTAPLAYTLSGFAAVVYVLITVLLFIDRPWARTTTWLAMAAELAGVLVIGALSVFDPELFPQDTVWSFFGRGYLFIPLLLPIIGIWWMLRQRIRPSVVTIGKFDGLHVGHMELIREAVEIAQEERLRSVVVTFDRHPDEVLNPADVPVLLAAATARNRQLAAAGVNQVEELKFTEALANLSPAEFVDAVLLKRLNARVVVVGSDFRFGHNASGTIDTLRALGAERDVRIVIADDVVKDGRRVSSTWVREALEAGDIELATRLLGHAPSVLGEVVHGLKRGRELGFPTANLGTNAQGFVPADGVYACWVRVAGSRYPSSVSIGLNPTFGDVTHRSVEAFLIDANLDLYGQVLEVEFVHRLRGMIAFPGREALIDQMHDDVRICREILEKQAAQS